MAENPCIGPSLRYCNHPFVGLSDPLFILWGSGAYVEFRGSQHHVRYIQPTASCPLDGTARRWIRKEINRTSTLLLWFGRGRDCVACQQMNTDGARPVH
eukprot:6492377-Amphidinium_carterae.2